MPDLIDLPEADYLYVEASQIEDAGLGLKTAIPIFKNERISLYKGEILTPQQITHRSDKNENQYFISLLDGGIMDSKHTDCFAKYANDAEGGNASDFKNNAKISLDQENNICLIATRKIKAGEEIFCSYGKRYWKKENSY